VTLGFSGAPGRPIAAARCLCITLSSAKSEGSSDRLREHADLMPEHLRSTASVASPVPATRYRHRNGGDSK
jgi:hypothetical protein